MRPVARLAHLSSVGALAYCSYAMCRSPVLPLFARDLGASPAGVGLIVAASTLTGVLLKLPAGTLSDVIGRRALLLVGAAVFAFLPLMYLAVGGLVALAALRVVHGSATALFGPVASATLADMAPAGESGRWLGMYAAAQGAGQSAGPVLAAALVVGNDYSRAFVGSAVLGAIALALIMRWPSARRVSPTAPIWPQLRQAVSQVIGDTPVLVASLAQAGQFFVNGTLVAFLPLHAHEQLGFSPWQIGWVFGLQTVATLLGRPVFGAFSDRVGRRPLVIAGLLTCAACMAALTQAEAFAAVLAVAMAYGVGLAVTTSATSALVTDLTRHGRYGAAHGLFGTIYDVGDALGPICAGLIAATFGYEAAFGAAGASAIVVALMFVWLSPGRPPTGAPGYAAASERN